MVASHSLAAVQAHAARPSSTQWTMVASQSPAAAQAHAARLMGQHNKQRQWKSALALFAALPLGNITNAACYVEAIRAHGALGQPGRALDTFTALERSGLPLSLVSFSAAIRACATENHWPIALSLLQDARDLGLEPDTIVCNAALSACERGGQWEEALLLLREMDCVEGSPPDRVSYNTAIAALSRGGQWRMAVELLDEMPRVVAPPHNTPDAHSFGAAISACGRGGQPEEALRLFQRMQADEAIPPNAIVYNAVIRACATPEHWAVALSLLDDARDDGIQLTANSFNCALAACEAGGQWEEALLLLDAMPEEALSPPDQVSYHTAIAACRRAVSIGAAAQRKGGRPAATAQTPGSDPAPGGGLDPASKAGAAKGSARGSDAERGWWGARRAARAAIGLLRRMHASRLRTSLIGYTTAMNALSAAGYVRAALCVYRGMAAEQSPDAKCVDTALGACERGSRWREGLELLKELRLRGPAGAALAAEFDEWAGKAERVLMREGQVRPGQTPPAEGRQQRGRGGGRGGRGRLRRQQHEREKPVRALRG